MLLDIDDSEIEAFETQLRSAAAAAIPYAVRDALNRTVFGGQKQIRHGLGKRMTLRNRWTEGSIQADAARGRDVDRMAAAVGSVAEYMAEQEEGFTRRAGGKHGVPIPTPFAAGQGHAMKRTRLVRKQRRMAAIKIKAWRRPGMTSDAQRNVVAVNVAVNTGRRFTFLRLPNGRKGIFLVLGGRRGQMRGWPKGANLEMVWDLTRRTVATKKREWLNPEVDKMIEKFPEMYRRALINQLKRNHLFQYNTQR